MRACNSTHTSTHKNMSNTGSWVSTNVYYTYTYIIPCRHACTYVYIHTYIHTYKGAYLRGESDGVDRALVSVQSEA
jgi:hypothetical protein